EMPEPLKQCPKCFSYDLHKSDHKLEIWHFTSIDKYEQWKDFKEKSFYKHYLVNDIVDYFPLYDTLQWENLLSDLY
ncbi:MAG: hypothetical protein KAS07_05810, partial [Candidatus Pacebacteria bacterium]|nr:hypothetical protein [Candidatus Paceibacterota bacterium]